MICSTSNAALQLTHDAVQHQVEIADQQRTCKKLGDARSLAEVALLSLCLRGEPVLQVKSELLSEKGASSLSLACRSLLVRASYSLAVIDLKQQRSAKPTWVVRGAHGGMRVDLKRPS